jgi:hypothetical protein
MNQLPIGAIVYDGVGLMDPTHAVKASQVGDAVSLYMRGRYLVPKSTVQAVVDSGGMVSPNWEDTGNILDQGHPSPLVMVSTAMSRLDDWGIDPTQVMTFFSTVDFGPTHAQYGPLDQIHQVLVTECLDVGLKFGLYGETGYLDHVGQQSWYPPDAGLWCWAGLGTFPGMTMKQEYGHANDPRAWQTIGCDTDSSVVYEPLAVHGKLVGPQPPQGGDMNYLWPCSDAGAVFFGTFDDKVAYSVRRVTGDEVALYQSIGVPSMPPRSHADFKHLILDGEPPELWRAQDPTYQGWDDSHFRWVNGRQPANPGNFASTTHVHDGGRSGPPVG